MPINESDSHPANVLRVTRSVAIEPGDVADAADRLTMIMEAEAIRNGLSGDTGEYGGEGSLEGMPYPLEDGEYTAPGDDSMELEPPHVISVEVAAMHYLDTDKYVDDESDQEKANPEIDQFNEPVKELTPEDQTLLGVDPYDE